MASGDSKSEVEELSNNGPAGRESLWVAVGAAVAGAAAASIVRYAIGATPADSGPQYILLVFFSWIGSGVILAIGYVLFLRAQSAESRLRVRICFQQFKHGAN